MAGKFYYKGRNGLEYPELQDAIKYGGGAVGKRFHNPVKTYEEIPLDELSEAENAIQEAEAKNLTAAEKLALEKAKANTKFKPKPTVPPANLKIDPPQAFQDYDQLSDDQLVEVLLTRGIKLKEGTKPTREQLLGKLKSMSSAV